MSKAIQLLEEINVYVSTIKGVVRDTLSVRKNSAYLAKLRNDILSHEVELVKDHPDLEETISYIKKTSAISAFNSPFEKKYGEMNVVPFFDEEKRLKCVIHKNKKLYYPRMMRKTMINMLYRSVCLEQDIDSPHRYLDMDENLNDYILFDCGCAEANFSLEVIDQVKKAYLFEGDDQWIRPLKATFSSWKDKVRIVRKYVGESGENMISLRRFMERLAEKGEIDFDKDNIFIKMDIEGFEPVVMNDILPMLREIKHLKMAVCLYHRAEHEKVIRQILPKEYVGRVRDGYMLFISEKDLPGNKKPEYPYFRHGIMRIERKTEQI